MTGAVEHLVVAIPSLPPLVIVLAFNRGRRNFSERDRQVLDLVRPHLAQAHRNAELRSQLAEMVVLLEGLADATDRAIVLLDQSRTVRRASRRAAALFAAHLGFRLAAGQSLPAIIEAWLTQSGRRGTLEDHLTPGQRFG